MLCRKQDAAPDIDCEAAHLPAHAAGEAELTRGIEKKKHAFANAVTLAARPQANPLRNGQVPARSGSANRILDVESDNDGLQRLAMGRGTPRDSDYRPGKNCARGASDQGEANRSAWRCRRYVNPERGDRRRLNDAR